MATPNLKILYILDRREKIQAAAIFVLMLLGAGFETLGIGLIPPFVNLLSQPSIVQKNQHLLWLYNATGMKSSQEFLIWASVGLIVVYALKNAYLSLVAYVQHRFIFSKQITLSRRLFSAYLYSFYTFHLDRNSAELIRNLSNEVVLMFNSVMVSGLLLLSEIMVATLVAVLLIVIEPLSSLVALGVIGIATLGFYRGIRQRTYQLGKARQSHAGKMIQWVNQGLGGLKEVKVLGREKFFLNAFTEECAGYARASQFLQTVSVLPRLFLESIAVILILLVVVVVLVQGKDIQSVIPTLSLFAFGALRLMPSANRMITTLTNIRYHHHSVDVIYNDLVLLSNQVKAPVKESYNIENTIEFNKHIEIKNVHYQYPNAKAPSLKGICLSIPKTHSIGFVGTSGAGKTTMVDVILGLLIPSEGEIMVDGKNIQDNLEGWHRKIGYIPQNIYLADDTIRGNIAFGVPQEEIDEEKVWAAVEAAQLKELVDSLPEQLYTMVGELGIRLSGGQRQRIGIARALYHEPEVLVMDEATAALDNETEREFTKALERFSGKKTLITIAHRLSTVKSCDRLYLMEKGKIICSGNYSQLFESSLEFRKLAMMSTEGGIK